MTIVQIENDKKLNEMQRSQLHAIGEQILKICMNKMRHLPMKQIILKVLRVQQYNEPARFVHHTYIKFDILYDEIVILTGACIDTDNILKSYECDNLNDLFAKLLGV